VNLFNYILNLLFDSVVWICSTHELNCRHILLTVTCKLYL